MGEENNKLEGPDLVLASIFFGTSVDVSNVALLHDPLLNPCSLAKDKTFALCLISQGPQVGAYHVHHHDR